jgi:hypothetical protein
MSYNSALDYVEQKYLQYDIVKNGNKNRTFGQQLWDNAMLEPSDLVKHQCRWCILDTEMYYRMKKEGKHNNFELEYLKPNSKIVKCHNICFWYGWFCQQRN